MVEKDKHNNFAWLSVYKYNALDTVKDVSTIYWCRGIVDNTGEAVICKVGFLADIFCMHIPHSAEFGPTTLVHSFFFRLA